MSYQYQTETILGWMSILNIILNSKINVLSSYVCSKNILCFKQAI